jgi:hypothetical protein
LMFVVTTGANAQYFTANANGKPTSFGLNPSVLHTTSFAKYAVADSIGRCNTS